MTSNYTFHFDSLSVGLQGPAPVNTSDWTSSAIFELADGLDRDDDDSDRYVNATLTIPRDVVSQNGTYCASFLPFPFRSADRKLTTENCTQT